MKIFIYKSLFVFFLILILFKLTIGALVNNYQEKLEELFSKEYINKIKKYISKNKLPIVVKADGLASGKGVTICKTREEAINAAKEILNGKFKSSKKVVIEEFLQGEEVSYFVLSDNNSYTFLILRCCKRDRYRQPYIFHM